LFCVSKTEKITISWHKDIFWHDCYLQFTDALFCRSETQQHHSLPRQFFYEQLFKIA
jgi:hypothetical protein